MNPPLLTEEEIFRIAHGISSPDLRSGYLKQVCGDDSQLFERVVALLNATAEDESFLENPPEGMAPTIDSRPITEKPGDVIGSYKLLQKIGEGGFGVVYMAEQTRPVRRKVALKVIKPGMDTKEVIARFEAERQALAMMNHPNIASVLDGGETESGRPYFVMELVKGVPLTQFCDEQKLGPKDRLALFSTVCSAIQHAHQKGVIHRDIKPANVMVTLHDGEPVPKVIDFGVSKAINQQLTEKTLFTNYGQMVGTPQYMSPEQAEMSGLDVDTRSDIYSLGVLLYELLTGTAPLEAEKLRQAGFAELQRLIKEEEPPKPSTRVSGIDEQITAAAKHRGMTSDALRRTLRGDLDWVVMKALDKDRNRRYETANALAMDIQRYLSDEPVSAGPPTTRYRLKKFISRNRGLVLSVTTVGASLLIGLALSLAGLIQANLAWKTAQVDARAAQAATERAEESQRILQARTEEVQLAHQRESIALRASERDREEAILQTKKSLELAARMRSNLYAAQINLASHALDQLGGISRIIGLISNWETSTDDTDLRGWEWYYLKSFCHKDLATIPGSGIKVNWVAYCPDGKHLASNGDNETLKVWDLATRECVYTYSTATSRSATAWSADGTHLYSADDLGAISVLKLGEAAPNYVLAGHKGKIMSLSLSPNGKRLASVGVDRTMRVWDLVTQTETLKWARQTSTVNEISWSPDGMLLAAGSKDGSFAVWSFEDTEQPVFLANENQLEVFSICWSADSRQVAISGEGAVVIRQRDNWKNSRYLKGHLGQVTCVRWSPQGDYLASASRDSTIKVWDASTWTERVTFQGHTRAVTAVSWSNDGKQLASSSDDGSIKLWDVKSISRTMPMYGHTDRVSFVCWSPDSLQIASASRDGTVKIWDAENGTERFSIVGHQGAAWSPDGEQIATAADDGNVRFYDTKTGRKTAEWRVHGDAVNGLSWHPNGRLLASTGLDGVVKIWQTGTGVVVATIPSKFGSVDNSVSWSPDGRLLATTGEQSRGTVLIWDFESGSPTISRRWESSQLRSLVWSPSGNRLAAAGEDRTIKIWDLKSNDGPIEVSGHALPVRSVAWSPDGQRIVSACIDGSLKLWATDSGQELLTLHGGNDRVWSVAWSPDGKKIASAGFDRTVRLWDARYGYGD